MTEHSAKRSGKSKTLTPEELDQVIHHLPRYKHQILALICRNCGCRIQEATLLTWDCFRDNQLTFPYFVTKGRLNTRDVPLTRKFIQLVLVEPQRLLTVREIIANSGEMPRIPTPPFLII